MEEVKLELAKLMGNPTANDGAGPSSSSSSTGASSKAVAAATEPTSAPASGSGTATAAAAASKPTDISHLIKRKKPETAPTDPAEQCSPAKRPAV